MLKRPLFVLFLLALKNDFASETYLRIKGKWQWVGVLVFICRDVCTYFLKNEKTFIRFFVPNLFFAVMHIFIIPDGER